MGSNAPLSVKVTKELAWRGLHDHPDDFMRYVAATLALLHASGFEGRPAGLRTEASPELQRSMSAPDTLLDALLYPKSITIIGASSDARKAGGRRWLSAIEALRAEGIPVFEDTTRPSMVSLHSMTSVRSKTKSTLPSFWYRRLPVLRTVEECARKRF